MSYYTTKVFEKSFDELRQRIEPHLQQFGFGIVSEVDMDQKFRAKLGVEFRRYKILGACNPEYAFQAVSQEEYIGLMLPCNVIMQERSAGQVEVSVIDPVASMQAVDNAQLVEMAGLIGEQLKLFLETL